MSTRLKEAMLDLARSGGRSTLTDEQRAEVRRRLADPSPTHLTMAEVRSRFAD